MTEEEQPVGYKENQERMVPQKPWAEGISIRSHRLFHTSEKSSRMSSKNSLLDLATQMSVFTLTRPDFLFFFLNSYWIVRTKICIGTNYLINGTIRYFFSPTGFMKTLIRYKWSHKFWESALEDRAENFKREKHHLPFVSAESLS